MKREVVLGSCKRRCNGQGSFKGRSPATPCVRARMRVVPNLQKILLRHSQGHRSRGALPCPPFHQLPGVCWIAPATTTPFHLIPTPCPVLPFPHPRSAAAWVLASSSAVTAFLSLITSQPRCWADQRQLLPGPSPEHRARDARRSRAGRMLAEHVMGGRAAEGGVSRWLSRRLSWCPAGREELFSGGAMLHLHPSSLLPSGCSLRLSKGGSGEPLRKGSQEARVKPRVRLKQVLKLQRSPHWNTARGQDRAHLLGRRRPQRGESPAPAAQHPLLSKF